MFKKYSIAKVVLIIGIATLVIKLIEPIVITKGCFGYNYFYEIISFGAPLFLIFFRF